MSYRLNVRAADLTHCTIKTDEQHSGSSTSSERFIACWMNCKNKPEQWVLLQYIYSIYCMIYSRTGPPSRARVLISPAGVPAQTSVLSATCSVPLSVPLCCASSPSSREVFIEVHLLYHSNVSETMTHVCSVFLLFFFLKMIKSRFLTKSFLWSLVLLCEFELQLDLFMRCLKVFPLFNNKSNFVHNGLITYFSNTIFHFSKGNKHIPRNVCKTTL